MACEEVQQGLLCLLLTSEIVRTNRGQVACPPLRQIIEVRRFLFELSANHKSHPHRFSRGRIDADGSGWGF